MSDTDDGFFSAATKLVRAPVPLLPQCGSCGLMHHCRSPKMSVDGEGRKGILICSEFPAGEEDLAGKPFVGNTGKLLRQLLADCDVDMRRDCFLTNALICKPANTKTYSERAVDFCRPNLLKTIRELNPSLILLLGGEAVRSLIGYLWKPNTGPIERWVGWQIPSVQLNSWVCPSYQPAQLLYENCDPVLAMGFKSHLRAAVGLSGSRPYKVPPRYEDTVETILDVSEAARRIRRYTSGMVSWDIEATTLKPEPECAEIVCCSVCWNGVETIAFPWHGEAVRAMAELLTNSDVGKIGYNCKYEDRYLRFKLGIEVRGWCHDGMLVAHLLDPRGGKDKEGKETSGVTGLKFQSFCLLGVPDYSSHVEPFLKSKDKSNNAPNRVREIGLTSLLRYCGTDSLLEYKVYEKQVERLGAL